MRALNLPSQASACQLCKSIGIQRSIPYSASSCRIRSRRFTSTGKIRQRTSTGTNYNIPTAAERGTKKIFPSELLQNNARPDIPDQSILENDIEGAQKLRNKILSSTSIPSDGLVMKALKLCEAIANALVESSGQVLSNKNNPATSALLSVSEKFPTTSATKLQKFSPATIRYANQLSDIAYSILIHPSVFITPEILARYVKLLSLLRNPETFPEIFTLYASKPLPEEGSSPIRYRPQNPNKPSNTIQNDVADLALQSAVDKRELVVAMDIVETTYATKAARRYKITRNGLLPFSVFAATPFAAYALASKFSAYQTTIDPAEATTVAFAGILAYVGFTSILGIVAVTTANDHMDRVTWAPGTPLRERWIREPERAAIDRIAGAWGFRQSWKKGEEEGEEWDALREWIGRKRMVLDQSDLLEGME